MNVPAANGKRIEQLERLVERLADEVKRLNELPRQQAAPDVFIARTRAPNGDDYPESPANTYDLEYLDGTFTEAAGNQTATLTARSAGSQGVAHDLASNRYIEEGTAGLVVRGLNGRRYFFPIDDTANQIKPIVRFTLGGALTKSTASQSATITHQYGPGTDNSTSITVHNLDLGQHYHFEGESGGVGLARHDTGTNYRVLVMEPMPGDANDNQPEDNQGYSGTSPVSAQGYLTGKLLASEAAKSVEIRSVRGLGLEVGQIVSAKNPTSRVTQTGVFEGARDAWCVITRNNLGELEFDVMECTEEQEEEYAPATSKGDQPPDAPLGAFGGAAVDDGEDDVFEFLGMNVRERAGVLRGEFGYKRELRRQAAALRGIERGRQREGAAHAAGRRYTNGMLSTWQGNLAMQNQIHRQIHQSWGNYYTGVNQLIGVLARNGGPQSHPAYRG